MYALQWRQYIRMLEHTAFINNKRTYTEDTASVTNKEAKSNTRVTGKYIREDLIRHALGNYQQNSIFIIL